MLEYMTKTDASDFFQEIRNLFADTDQRFKDTNQEIKDTQQILREANLEAGKMIKDLRASLGQLGGRLGDFVEEMVKPAAVRLFMERGLEVRQVFQNVARYDDHGQFLMEIDLLVVDTDTAVAIECKSKCSVDDVAEHLDRLSRFKEYFPQYAAFHLYGAVAAMVIPDEVARFAYRKGLYVLAQSGDTIQIRNDARFQPKQW
jgi:hypothetical protein